MYVPLRRCSALEKVDGGRDEGSGHEGSNGNDDDNGHDTDKDHDDDMTGKSKRLLLTDSSILLYFVVLVYIPQVAAKFQKGVLQCN